MDQILGQVLRRAVWERLDLLDELAANADQASLESVARTELPRLTDGWRALLAAHEADAKGNCRGCSARWRPHRAPCSVWQAAREHLLGNAVGDPAATSVAAAAASTTSPAGAATTAIPAEPAAVAAAG